MKLRFFLLAVTTTLLSGCFDVDQTETGGRPIAWARTRVVDDFESGFFPTWTLLRPWQCNAWSDDQAACDAGSAAPGLEGADGHAGFLSFDLAGEGYPGANLATGGNGYALDFTRYDQLVFSAKLEASEGGSLPPDVELRVRLDCPGIAEVVSPTEESVAVAAAVWPVPGGPARKFAVTFERQAPWQDWELIDPQECVANAESLAFEIASGTPDNAFAGTLTLDDIQLDDFEGREPSEELRFSPWYCLPGAVCDASGAVPTATFPDSDPTGPREPGSFCISAEKVDPTSHELEDDTRNFGALEAVSFAASFMPTDPAAKGPARFTVRLGCAGLAVGSSGAFPGVSRDIEIFADRSSYTLSFSSFGPSPWPVGFDNVEGCLEQVDQVCLDAPEGHEVGGTLTLFDLVLR